MKVQLPFGEAEGLPIPYLADGSDSRPHDCPHCEAKFYGPDRRRIADHVQKCRKRQ